MADCPQKTVDRMVELDGKIANLNAVLEKTTKQINNAVEELCKLNDSLVAGHYMTSSGLYVLTSPPGLVRPRINEIHSPSFRAKDDDPPFEGGPLEADE